MKIVFSAAVGSQDTKSMPIIKLDINKYYLELAYSNNIEI